MTTLPAKSGEPSSPDLETTAQSSSEGQPKQNNADAPRARAGQAKKHGKFKRWLLAISGAIPVLVIALWFCIHEIPWLGPLVANTLRAVIGTENVTRLEDIAYGFEDRFNRAWKKDEQPKAYWDVKSARQAAPPPPPATEQSEAALPPFALKDPGPVHESWSAPGDGQWVPIVDPRRPNDEVRMFKTLLHPDKNRSWADLFVVAVDLARVEVHPVAGYQEPKSELPEAENYERHAKIPEKHHPVLLAAFNGGFMTEHGGYGMKLDEVTLVAPKAKACTVAKFQDGRLRVAPWQVLSSGEPRMLWFRQAPNCMVVDGEMHPLLRDNVRHWGATLDGETVIRRSAIGMAKDGTTMFVGISNHTTARVMAEGMQHAGAVQVAQLDVNWSYPKFVLYEPKGKGGSLIAIALAEGFEFSKDEYIRSRSMRDFFYLTRKAKAQSPTEPAP